MSDTPETDDQPIIYAMNDKGYQVPCVDLEFARKLERERDEANEELHKQLVRYDELFAGAEQIRIERDEAREAFVIATDQMVIAQGNVREANKERDKARTELEMWRDGNIMHQIHRDELEKTERERDEAREAFREMWQSGDAFLPHVDAETISRWHKAAGWEGAK